jgi:hypothetical protein
MLLARHEMRILLLDRSSASPDTAPPRPLLRSSVLLL